MMKKILLPLDGSSLAESVLPLAVLMAGKLDASVTLLHIIEKKSPKGVHGDRHLNDPDLAEKYLRTIGERYFPGQAKIAIHVHTAGEGNVAKAIFRHRDEFDFDLIILCTHGKGAAGQFLLGSMGLKIAGLCSIPVLIHSGETGLQSAEQDIRSILFPIDQNPEHRENAFVAARELALRFGAAVHFVMVIPTFGTLSGPAGNASTLLPGTTARMLEMSLDEAEEDLAEQKALLEKDGITATVSLMRGRTEKNILKAAALFDADLILMGTHGKSGLKAFWEGSVASRVASRARKPVLLVPV
jgi:nucleotide-binding universal stress UspA family protein